jgi:hypothetical protein
MDLKEIGCEGVDRKDMSHDIDTWRALASVKMNLCVPWNAEDFLTSRKRLGF